MWGNFFFINFPMIHTVRNDNLSNKYLLIHLSPKYSLHLRISMVVRSYWSLMDRVHPMHPKRKSIPYSEKWRISELMLLSCQFYNFTQIWTTNNRLNLNWFKIDISSGVNREFNRDGHTVAMVNRLEKETEATVMTFSWVIVVIEQVNDCRFVVRPWRESPTLFDLRRLRWGKGRDREGKRGTITESDSIPIGDLSGSEDSRQELCEDEA